MAEARCMDPYIACRAWGGDDVCVQFSLHLSVQGGGGVVRMLYTCGQLGRAGLCSCSSGHAIMAMFCIAAGASFVSRFDDSFTS